jgi:uncharacterized protein (TIGR03437 family)
VKVNGNDVPVVYASQRRVDFVCPAADAGTVLSISAEAKAGAANPVTTTMQETTPGLFSLDGSGSGQAWAYLAGTSVTATSRDYQGLGQPAQPGDAITIRATGIGSPEGPPPIVLFGDFQARLISVQPLPGVVGVFEITIETPPGSQEGDDIPLMLVTSRPAGPLGSIGRAIQSNYRVRSNQVTVATELGHD